MGSAVLLGGRIVMQPANTERFQRFAKATEWPLGVLALLIIPSILLDDHEHRLRFHEIALWLNWIVWLGFCGELAVKAWLAPDRRYFLRHAWFDLVIVALSPPFIGPEYLQGLRTLRLVRVVRLFRFVRALAVAGIALESARDVLAHRRLHYVVLATAVIVSLGAFGIYGVEHGQNPAIGSIGDAFWWAVVTATTVGYGDISPTTTEGRLIAVLLMLVGIGAISILTATVASFFFQEDKEQDKQVRAAEFTRLENRLASLETKQDQVLEAVNRFQGELR
jgi:voltage-gated potassium channel